ncbi:MAG: polyprenyl synthetase family protein [Thermoanaerobaculia bacterium]|nr:polyprenyl synthetase family protein [Thermoanaerobaculia bacterium]
MPSSSRAKASEAADDLLEPADLEKIRRGFEELLPVGSEVERHLAGATSDILRHAGSLARAQLAFALARAYGLADEPAVQLAIGVEYFHTASLVFDDLPAMDDAHERRGRPCPHLAFGESSAILAALAFVHRGYGLLWDVLGPLPSVVRQQAIQLVDECLGLQGVLGGQALDLQFDRTVDGSDQIVRVARGKTVSLIRLTLTLTARVAEASTLDVERFERLSDSWGLAYQILDDARDRLLSGREAGKSTARDDALGRPNFSIENGWDSTLAELDTLLETSRREIAGLSRSVDAVDRLQSVLETETAEVRERILLRHCA